MGLCGIGGKLNSSGYKSKFLFAAKQKQKHTHTQNTMICSLPQTKAKKKKEHMKGCIPILAVDHIPRKSPGHLPGAAQACPQLYTAVQTGEPLQVCWISPRMSASFSIYRLFLLYVTLTLLFNRFVCFLTTPKESITFSPLKAITDKALSKKCELRS